jgi:hypothetical protein
MTNNLQPPSDVADNEADKAPRILHIRYASMDDALSDMSSLHTSVFSKPTSITTKSSEASLGAADRECSRLIDALTLESYNDCSTRTIALHKSSLTNIGWPNSKSNDSKNSISGLDGTYQETPIAINEPDICTTFAVAFRLTLVPQVHADIEVEGGPFTIPVNYEAQHKASWGARWMNRLKWQARKVPRKAHDLVMSTKRFARIFVKFVPVIITTRSVLEAL